MRPRVRVLAYSGSGIETTFTQGEDACLAALVAHAARRGRRRRARACWWSGSLADVVEDQFARLFEALGVPRVRFFPMRTAGDLPPVGPNTRFLLAQPFLGETARALEARGAQAASPRRFRSAPRARPRGCSAAADAFGVRESRFDAVTARGARARRDGARPPSRDRSPASASSSSPTSQLEIPLARFLARELGMVPIEVGTPYLIASSWPRIWRSCPPASRLSEGQDVDASARPLPRRAARSHGLRPRPRQSARGRGARDQMVDRTAVRADPGLRAGGRSRRTLCAPARPARGAGGLGHGPHALDIRRAAACRRDARRDGDARPPSTCCMRRRATPTPICCSR